MTGSWSKVSSLSLKPLGSWFKDIVAKVEFMISWIEEGPPAAFWVSAFFFPQGFLTAALHTYARRTATAIDTLDFATEVCVEQGPEDVTAPHEDGVYTYGCFMEVCYRTLYVLAQSMVLTVNTGRPMGSLENEYWRKSAGHALHYNALYFAVADCSVKGPSAAGKRKI